MDKILSVSNKSFTISRLEALPVFAKALGKDRNPAPAIVATRKKVVMPHDKPLPVFLNVSLGPSPFPCPMAVLMPSAAVLTADLIALLTLLWEKVAANSIDALKMFHVFRFIMQFLPHGRLVHALSRVIV